MVQLWFTMFGKNWWIGAANNVTGGSERTDPMNNAVNARCFNAPHELQIGWGALSLYVNDDWTNPGDSMTG